MKQNLLLFQPNMVGCYTCSSSDQELLPVCQVDFMLALAALKKCKISDLKGEIYLCIQCFQNLKEFLSQKSPDTVLTSLGEEEIACIVCKEKQNTLVELQVHILTIHSQEGSPEFAPISTKKRKTSGRSRLSHEDQDLLVEDSKMEPELIFNEGNELKPDTDDLDKAAEPGSDEVVKQEPTEAAETPSFDDFLSLDSYTGDDFDDYDNEDYDDNDQYDLDTKSYRPKKSGSKTKSIRKPKQPRIEASDYKPKDIPCHLCQESYPLVNIDSHYKSIHPEVQPKVICTFCAQPYYSPAIVEAHISHCIGCKLVFRCSVCPRFYADPFKFAQHQEKHRNANFTSIETYR